MRRISKLGIWVVLASTLIAPAIGAQTVSSGKPGRGCVGIDSVVAATNNPFSAWRITQSMIKSPDGSQKVTKLAERIARDRDGRIRVERIVKVSAGAPEITLPTGDGENVTFQWDGIGTSIMLMDCSTGEEIWTQPDTMIAQVRSLGAGSTPEQRNRFYRSPSSTLLGHPFSPHLSAEDLGSKQIMGIAVQGVRVTTFGTDEWEGKPILINETWASIDLAATVVDIKKGLKNGGESKQMLLEINREEPDASLFVIPSGYTTRRESESHGPASAPAPHE